MDGEGWGSPEDLCTSPLLEPLLSHKQVKKERVDWLREEIYEEDASQSQLQEGWVLRVCILTTAFGQS